MGGAAAKMGELADSVVDSTSQVSDAAARTFGQQILDVMEQPS